MESTRTEMTLKNRKSPTLSASEISELLYSMHDVKEILYFSICRPEIFKDWVEKHTQSAEKETLKEFSRLFVTHFLPGFAYQEYELLGKQQEIFQTRKELVALRKELKAVLEDKESLEGTQASFAANLKRLCDRLEELLAERNDYAKSAEIVMSAEQLHGLWVYQIEIIKVHSEIHDIIEDYLAAGRNSIDSRIISLVHDIGIKFITVSEGQREVEKHVCEKRKMHEYQAAIVTLMLENRIDKLTKFFKENADIAEFLYANLVMLKPIQKKMHEYLDVHPELIPRKILPQEDQETAKAKADASKNYQEKRNNEVAQQKEAVINQEKTILENYEVARVLYNKNNFPDALNCYLKGARDFNHLHLQGAADMILRGEGCPADASAACHFFRAAVVTAATEEQKNSAQEKLKGAYRKALAEPNVNSDLCMSDVRKKIREVCLEIEDLEKKIKSQGFNYDKFFNAADAYLAQYKVELVYSKSRSGEVSPSLQNACYYFVEAYVFANRLYQNSRAVFENFLVYAKNSGVDLEQIDDSTLDNDEKAIYQRFIEVEKAAEQAKRLREQLSDKIARKLAPLYFFIEHKEDKAMVDELCVDLDIDMGLLTSNGIKRNTL